VFKSAIVSVALVADPEFHIAIEAGIQTPSFEGQTAEPTLVPLIENLRLPGLASCAVPSFPQDDIQAENE
jgi:hypothetical protein